MQMENIVLTPESRLITLIDEAVGRYFKVETPKSEPVNISGTKEAVKFLKEKGFEISESLFTKSTAQGRIPCRRFHNKRLLFNRKELLLWAESKCEPIGHSEAALMLAASGNRKLRGRK
jgi:hypothetical protein